MIDVREQILKELLKVTQNVRITKPEAIKSFPLIVYGEISNVLFDKWQARIEYQVDVYTTSFESLISLTNKVNEKMENIGFNRTFISPDYEAREDTKIYHKTIGYVAMVNTNEKNIYSKF